MEKTYTITIFTWGFKFKTQQLVQTFMIKLINPQVYNKYPVLGLNNPKPLMLTKINQVLENYKQGALRQLLFAFHSQ